MDSQEGEREGNSSFTPTSALPSTLHVHCPHNSTMLQMAMKIAEQNIPTDMLESRTRPVLCPVSVNLQSAATRDGGYFPVTHPCSG